MTIDLPSAWLESVARREEKEMRLIYHPVVLRHETGMHPENPKRLELFSDLEFSDYYDGTPFLELIHTPDYVDWVRRACRQGAPLDPDTMTSPGSFEAACYAVGATLLASESGDFALVRPPGHHAYADKASGFCLFNNVAIAARRLTMHGKRVLIFDFDGHLGDGTADLFYRTAEVMYWSMHQYPAFPGHGRVDEIGEGRGKGFTINTLLPPGSGDDIFLHALEHYLPIALQFQPDVVAVSAGFDAHQYDLLLDLKVSAYTYYLIGRKLRENFNRLFATLEGGYNVPELKNSVMAFLAGVNGLPSPVAAESTVSGLRVWETYEMYLHSGLNLLKTYWKM